MVTKKIVKDGQNQEIIETSGYNVKEWLHFVDCISFLSNLLKWILRATNSGAASLVFSDTQWESMFGLMQDPQLTMDGHRWLSVFQTQRSLSPRQCPACRLDEATVKCPYLSRGTALLNSMNASGTPQRQKAICLGVQAMSDGFLMTGILPLKMLTTQAMVNTVIKAAPFTWVPHITLLL